MLNDAQVQRVLRCNLQLQAWNEERKKVLRSGPSPARLGWIKGPCCAGCPRSTRDIELLIRIRKWHRALSKLLAARARIESMRGLAREFGVSDTTIGRVARCNGEYKQASPELIAETRLQRRVRLDRLKRMNLY
ncbi:MAG: hypothetical protein WDO56_05720 [Gammaproteobacteria bacterium]